MDIRQLRYFLAIADNASFMKASERLNIAQSSLSVHIRNLESELDCRLLIRSSRGVTLTDAGLKLHARARSLIDSYQELVHSLKRPKDVPFGSVSIGIPSGVSARFSIALYKRVKKQLPGIELYIADASSLMIYEWLLDSRIDYCILFNLPDDNSLLTDPLGSEAFYLVSRQGWGNPDEAVDLEAIYEVPLILPCRSSPWRKVLDHIALRQGRALNVLLETESVNIIKAVLFNERAYSLLPRASVIDEIEAGTLVAQKLRNPELKGSLSLVSLPGVETNCAKREMRKVIVDVARDVFRQDGGSSEAEYDITLRALPECIMPRSAISH